MIDTKKNCLNLKELKTPLKILIPLWFVFFVFAFSIFFIFIPSLKNNLINQKKETIQKLTDSAVSLLAEYNQRVQSGELTLEDAKSRATNRIRNLKYGPKGKDYFWITDMHPFMIMHPYRPDLETSDVTSFRDLEGNYPFMAMVETVLKNKSGYVNYFWESQDAPQQVVPKISYVKGFEPWGWIVGTGIYIEDVNFEIKNALDGLKTIFICILLLILCLSAYITWQTIRSRGKKKLMEEAFRKEKETLSMILERTPHGISLVDNDGKYLYLNPYYTKITGYTLEDIPSKKEWFEKAYPDENYREEISEAWNKDILDGELEKIREFKIKCKNGDTKHIEFRSAFLKDKKIF